MTGPRQSGKTTLCRMAFSDLPYRSLEPVDTREYAIRDPRGFLKQFPDGAVLDEVQRAPDLLSYLQDRIDDPRDKSRWVLTGSQNFSLLQSMGQSLAGRTGIVHLLPLSFAELCSSSLAAPELDEVLTTGGYPRIFAQDIHATDFFSTYVTTYVERDVRQILQVRDLITFQRFVALCAGRAGQLLDLSNLGDDTGITHNTAKSWISVLEASYLAFRLPPIFRNWGKRLIKRPKLYFYDTGLLCHLLQIRNPVQLAQHPLRGAIFENWVISEILKARYNAALPADLYFYRDRKGTEVDAYYSAPQRTLAVEAKSGMTFRDEQLSNLRKLQQASADPHFNGFVIYGGDDDQQRTDATVLSWKHLEHLLDIFVS